MVKIINYTTNASSHVASAGRISTTKGTAGEIYESALEKGDEGNVNLIGKILASGHESVLEHVNVNLAFDDVSVFVEQFMIEFRLASFTVKSRRYVDFSQMGYYVPDFSGNKDWENAYKKHTDELFALYEKLVEAGVPKEDARFVLPYCFKSNFYCTLNLRELKKIISEMIYGRGKNYPELVAVGKELNRQCQEMFSYLVPEEVSYDEAEEKIAALMEDAENKVEKEELASAPQKLVSWITGTKEPETVICRTAAQLRGYPVENVDNLTVADNQEVIRQILKGGRKRELEQVNFTFRFNRISLSGVTHLVRHRMQAIAVPEYEKVYDFSNYVLPESIAAAGLVDEYKKAFQDSEALLKKLLKEGFYPKNSIYFMLSGMTIPVTTTMNGNELETFMRLRTCSRAQWEIKECADALLEILREKYPVLFSLYGPGCYRMGRCPEGRMTCGKMKEVCERYSNVKY